MLDKLRNAASSWVALILIVPLILAFAVWGVGDIFRGITNTDVARVGDTGVAAADFDREFRNTVQRLSRQTNGAIDSLQARSMGFDKQVLAGMVQRTALLTQANEMGLATSDATLKKRIEEMEVFQGGFGGFSPQTYAEVLAVNNMTPEGFEASLRDDITREQLMGSITLGALAPKRMAEALYAHQAERRKVAYLVLLPEEAGDIAEPTDEELKAYFDLNAPQYTAPEYRGVSFLWIEPQDLVSKVVVDEQEVLERYNFDQNRFATPERRNVQVLPFLTDVDAKAAADKLGGGFTFEGLVEEKGLSLEDITQENVTEFDMTDSLIAKAAFTLVENEISAPVNGQLGWALIRVTAITPGEAQDPEEAKKTIHDELALELARNLLYDVLTDLDDEIAGGASLEEVGARLDLSVGTLAGINLSGQSADGTRPAHMPTERTFVSSVFEAEEGETSDLLDTENGGAYVFRVDSIKEPAVKPLDSIKADVVTDYVRSKRREALDALATSIMKKANAGEPFDALAASMDRAILSPDIEIPRGYTSEIISAPVGMALFRSKVGEYISGPAGFGQSYVVAVTREIIDADIAASAPQIKQISDQLRTSYEGDLADQYIVALQESMNVEIYQSVIDATLGSLDN